MSSASSIDVAGDDFIEHKLCHVQQRYSWDCGVSSILMLLDAEQRRHFIDNFDAICLEEGFHESTWTIDLCYLLKRYNIEHTLYTTNPGVNESYKKYSYYQKIIDMDRARVIRRFSEAPSRGIRVVNRALLASELYEHMEQGPAILLIDHTLLVCQLCQHNKMRYEIRRMFGGSYSGHYVVASGRGQGRILYHDPSVQCGHCLAPVTRVHRAAQATGTDCDAILVYRHYR